MLRTWLSPARPAPATTPGRHARLAPRDRSRAARAGRPRPRTPRRPPGRTSRRSRASSSRPSRSTTRRPTCSPSRDAFDLAVEAHTGQLRATGEPYVTHPIASAQITAELGIDPVAVQAALLHDVPEDTEYSLQDIEERFGAEVARIVDGVTKLSKFSTHSHEQQQAENIRKMLLAMAEDIRVVLIKLADRLHNMRTLYGAAVGEAAADRPPDAWRSTPRSPSGSGSGRSSGSWRTSRSRSSSPSTSGSSPSCSTRAARAARATSSGRSPSSSRASSDAGIEADLQGRPKHIYSIDKKMQRKCGRVRRDLRRLRDPDPRRRGPRLLRARSASSTPSGGRSRASSTTTSRSPRTTSTSRSTPR